MMSLKGKSISCSRQITNRTLVANNKIAYSQPEASNLIYLERLLMLPENNFIAYLQATFYCQQIMQGPSALALRQKAEDYDRYYYLPQSLTASVLLNDSMNYLLQRQAQTGSRQVVFLLELESQELGALILRCSQLDNQYANRLVNLLTQEREQLLANHQSAKLFHPLYHRIECCLIGSAAVKSALQHWLSLLRQIYGQPKVTYQPLASAHNQEIVWAEGLRQWLTHGELKAIDVKQASEQQFQLLLTTFRDQWARIQAQEPILYRTIADQLGILLKYAWLQAYRQKLELPATITREQLQAIQLQDQQWKQQIYQTAFADVADYFDSLNRQTLGQLILQPAPSYLLAYLQSERQRQQVLLRDWETVLINHIDESSSWFTWGYRAFKRILRSFYQHSPVSTSSFLAQWGGEHLTAAYEHHPRIGRIKQCILTAIETITFGLTRSPHLAQKSRIKAERWLTRASVIFLSKAIGGGMGLGYSYFAGSYAVSKWIIASFISRWLYKRFNQPQLDEERARVISAGRQLLSATSCAQVTHLAVATAETAVTRDYRYLLQALGGAASSMGAITLCQKVAGNLQEAADSTEENKIIARFFITLISYDFGQKMADYLYQWYEQLTLCQSASQAFNTLANNQSWVAWQTQCPTPVDGFYAIFRPAKPLQLYWITKAGDYHETKCQVLKYHNTLGQAICETPTVATQLRLT
jgi:hypothetical protein